MIPLLISLLMLGLGAVPPPAHARSVSNNWAGYVQPGWDQMVGAEWVVPIGWVSTATRSAIPGFSRTGRSPPAPMGCSVTTLGGPMRPKVILASGSFRWLSVTLFTLGFGRSALGIGPTR